MSRINSIIEKLEKENDLTDSEFLELLHFEGNLPLLTSSADRVRREIYGTDVYIRGLMEYTNYCKNNCLYCGIRCANTEVPRYRLSKDDILMCCRKGYGLGFRTFVLQGGEDPYFTDDIMCDIIFSIKDAFPDCAVTLSIGEKSRSSYQAFFDAGADRYLLRHETATESHYTQLHPDSMSFRRRMDCLYDLKDIGYQVGAGFMTGSPYQTYGHILADLRFLQKLRPDMIGIGPYLTHHQTPFACFKNGDPELTLRLLSIIRLMLPYVLLPSTTALSTADPEGRILGLKAGANVVMPNLSPGNVRDWYSLYENKANSGAEAAESLMLLKAQVEKAGYQVVTDVGHVKAH